MTRSAERGEAYAAVDGERDYQNQAWGYGQEAYPLTVGEFVLLLEEYAAKARREWVADQEPAHDRADAETLKVVRKVAALAVNCMEQHGAPHREGFERDSNPVTRARLPGVPEGRFSKGGQNAPPTSPRPPPPAGTRISERQEEPPVLDTRALLVEVEGVRDAGKDIRQQVVWVQYGTGGARHELRMPYGDAVKLRGLLVAMRLLCTRCGRKSSMCTPTTCYVPGEEVR